MNSDGSITIISEEDLANYNVAIAGAASSSSSPVKAGATAAAIHVAQAQAQQQQAYASNSSIASLGGAQASANTSGSGRNIAGEAEGRVKVDIEIPDQYPQVYIKTEEVEEDEQKEEGVPPTLASRQAAILNQTQLPAAVVAGQQLGTEVSGGQTAVVVMERPAAGESEGGMAGQVQSSGDAGTADSATVAGDDDGSQQAAATQVCKIDMIIHVHHTCKNLALQIIQYPLPND